MALQVVHPIHDQTFYLSTEHKRRLKEEYGIESWTFVQKLGDAVIIPAGCPYQIRNLKLAGTRLTPKLYGRVTEAFVCKYGKYAGWAQSLLFIAELPSQKPRIIISPRMLASHMASDYIQSGYLNSSHMGFPEQLPTILQLVPLRKTYWTCY